jgi:hypothetical protein
VCSRRTVVLLVPSLLDGAFLGNSSYRHSASLGWRHTITKRADTMRPAATAGRERRTATSSCELMPTVVGHEQASTSAKDDWQPVDEQGRS